MGHQAAFTYTVSEWRCGQSGLHRRNDAGRKSIPRQKQKDVVAKNSSAGMIAGNSWIQDQQRMISA
jgi:hypothetical protein